ncbi:MAG: hypothetical protein J6Z11_15835 [Candidatus Riflebacteria bacterium]|nr:hypothetical protein [Candidatus Riflebacteria bacterium]
MFVFITNLCLANDSDPDIFPLKDLLIPLLFTLIMVLGLVYFRFYIPYVKRKKTKEFCQKNHLTFTEESKKLPDNIDFKFIKFDAGKNGESVYKNIMQGTKNGISFIMSEFSFKYTFKNSSEEGYATSPSFSLFIIKKPKINFPYFFLRRPNDLANFKILGRVSFKKVNRGSTLHSDYVKHIHFYQNKKLILLEDQQFNKTFEIDVDDEENAKLYFDDKVRKFFIQKAEPKTVYEGNSEYFIISTSEITKFEDMIKFFEKSLKFYVELTSI